MEAGAPMESGRSLVRRARECLNLAAERLYDDEQERNAAESVRNLALKRENDALSIKLAAAEAMAAERSDSAIAAGKARDLIASERDAWRKQHALSVRTSDEIIANLTKRAEAAETERRRNGESSQRHCEWLQGVGEIERKRADAAERALRAAEWTGVRLVYGQGPAYVNACPLCGKVQGAAHVPDCPIGAALAPGPVTT